MINLIKWPGIPSPWLYQSVCRISAPLAQDSIYNGNNLKAYFIPTIMKLFQDMYQAFHICLRTVTLIFAHGTTTEVNLQEYI